MSEKAGHKFPKTQNPVRISDLVYFGINDSVIVGSHWSVDSSVPMSTPIGHGHLTVFFIWFSLERKRCYLHYNYLITLKDVFQKMDENKENEMINIKLMCIYIQLLITMPNADKITSNQMKN